MADMYATCHVFDLNLQLFGHAFRLYTYKHGGMGAGLGFKAVRSSRVGWVGSA